MEKKTLNELITEAATVNVGRFNFMKNQTEKEIVINHHKICKELVRLSREKNFPITTLVYVAIGTNAHKPSVFAKYYRKINTERALTVIELNKMFSDRFGEKWFGYANLVHLLSRFIDLGGTKEKFSSIIKNLAPEDVNSRRYDSAKKLGSVIFKGTAQFAKCGFISELKDE